jgi:DNA-binding NarL/FixJ family response regulator
MSDAVRIAVVDDHPMVRAGIAYTLEPDPEFELVASGESAEDAIRIAHTDKPDMMLLDVDMPGGGLEAARAIRLAHPSIRVIFLTVSERHEDVIAALEAGVRGYILKGISGPDLLRTLHSVSTGETYITPGFATRLLAAPQQRPKIVTPDLDLSRQLSIREIQVLKEVARGRTNKEIAISLNLTEKTIKHYMSNALSKLSVRNRMEAVNAAKQILGVSDA